MRIVSLAPGPTEILFALGLDAAVVGVSHDSDFPPAALALPRVTHLAGDLAAVDSERLAALAPGLIFATNGDGQSWRSSVLVRRMLATRLDRRPHVYGLAPTTVGDVLSSIKTVGDATSAQDRARELLLALRSRIDRVTLRTAGVPDVPRVACLVALDPPVAAGGWVPELVGMAGGYDVLGSAGRLSSPTSWDEVAARAPEVLVLLDGAGRVGETAQRPAPPSPAPGWPDLEAIRAGRVFSPDATLLLRPGPRLVDGLEWLAGLLHPALFEAPGVVR